MIFSQHTWTIEEEDAQGIDSLTSDGAFVRLAKVHGFSKMRGKHQKPECVGQDPRVIDSFRVLDEDGDEIESDDELRRTMAHKIRSQNILHSPFGQPNKYAIPNDAPAQSATTRTDWEKANVDVICPDCAALSTARLIEMAQGPEAAEEFMRGVMSEAGGSESRYSSSSILSYGASKLGSEASYKAAGSGTGASYDFSIQY